MDENEFSLMERWFRESTAPGGIFYHHLWQMEMVFGGQDPAVPISLPEEAHVFVRGLGWNQMQVIRIEDTFREDEPSWPSPRHRFMMKITEALTLWNERAQYSDMDRENPETGRLPPTPQYYEMARYIRDLADRLAREEEDRRMRGELSRRMAQVEASVAAQANYQLQADGSSWAVAAETVDGEVTFRAIQHAATTAPWDDEPEQKSLSLRDKVKSKEAVEALPQLF